MKRTVYKIKANNNVFMYNEHSTPDQDEHEYTAKTKLTMLIKVFILRFLFDHIEVTED